MYIHTYGQDQYAKKQGKTELVFTIRTNSPLALTVIHSAKIAWVSGFNSVQGGQILEPGRLLGQYLCTLGASERTYLHIPVHWGQGRNDSPQEHSDGAHCNGRV